MDRSAASTAIAAVLPMAQAIVAWDELIRAAEAAEAAATEAEARQRVAELGITAAEHAIEQRAALARRATEAAEAELATRREELCRDQAAAERKATELVEQAGGLAAGIVAEAQQKRDAIQAEVETLTARAADLAAEVAAKEQRLAELVRLADEARARVLQATADAVKG